jgi:hypothetical protein
MRKGYKSRKFLDFRLGFFFLMLSSCSSIVLPEKPETAGITFKHDLIVEVNGSKFKGIGVVPRHSQYTVKITPDEKIDRLIWQTCHQDDVIDKPKTGWFNKSYEFVLKDVPGVVDVTSCSLELISMNEAHRQNAFATIEFLDTRPEVSLPALLKCSGVMTNYSQGVSICQSSAGLVQQITFSEPVVNEGADGTCNVMNSKDRLVYTFFMPKGKCTYYFVAKTKLGEKRLLHRLQTIGYTDVPLKD